jgi:hypothetical protein
MPCPRCGNNDARCSTKPNGWVWCSGVSDAPGWRRLGAGIGPAFYVPVANVGQPIQPPAPVPFVGANPPQAVPSPSPAPTPATPPQRTVPEENRATRGLVRWLTRRGGRCSPRDLQRANAKYRTRLTAEIALNNLVELGLVTKSRHRPPTGGRSVPIFTLVDANKLVSDDSKLQPTNDRFS